MEHIDVMYTVDKNYLNYMLVSIYSFLENNNGLNTTFHIICDGFTLEDYAHVERIVQSFDKADVNFYDFEAIKDLIVKYDIPKWNNSYVSNARLFFNKCIKDTEKILYLDADTIVTDSVVGLDNYDGTVCMVKDSVPETYFKSLDSTLQTYYNSGVLWINTDKWNENECLEKLLKSLEDKRTYTYPDQDLINISLRDDISTLPLNYNLLTMDAYYDLPMLYKYYSVNNIPERYSKTEIKDARENPVILHGTPFYNWKAWDNNAIHPYSKYYDEYFAKIGLSEIDKSDAPNEELYKIILYLKLICPEGIKSRIKEFVRK